MSLSVVSGPKPTNVRSDVLHNWELMQNVYKLYNEQKYTDILFEFLFTSYTLSAHRLILAAASSYFKDIFDNIEPDCNYLTVTEIDSDTFEQLVVYCYNGQTDITAGNTERMIKGAMLLRLYDVVDTCVNYAMDHINDFLLRKLILLEAEIQYKPFEVRLLAYIVQNFKKINRNEDMVNLNVEQWKVIVEKVDANIVSQEDLFWIIMLWYEYNTADREKDLPILLGSLRLTEFDTEFILKQIKPLPGCERLAIETLKKRESLLTWMAIQNWGEDWLGFKDILRYNQAKEVWEKVKRLEIKRYIFSTAFIDNSLIFIGGRNRDGPSKDVVGYNLITETWTTMPAMQENRNSVCVAVVNNYLYAIGGKDKKGNVLSSMERYSTLTGHWQFVASMSTPRFEAGIAILNGDIYIVGGKTNVPINTVERYNVTKNSWLPCSSMSDARESPAVVTHQGYIYALSGRYADLKTVERYNPEQDEWTKIASLNVARRYICAASIGNQLWSFGGVIGSAQWDDTVEVYDMAKDKWLVKQKLPVTGKFSCVSVPTKLVEKLV